METITIAGVILDQSEYPNLFKLGVHNPEGLEALLQSLHIRTGSESMEMTAINLEMDMAHERLCK